MSEIVWRWIEMKDAAWGYWNECGEGLWCDYDDLEVIRIEDGHEEPYLVVWHRPSGRITSEFGDSGKWHLDGTAF